MLQAKQRLRDMSVYRVSSATISHVAIHAEVQRALNAWIKLDINSVLIGGLAMSLYAKPRMTEDVDVLFLHDSDMPSSLPGFKKVATHNFQENRTHVIVEMVTSHTVNIPQELVDRVFTTAVSVDGMRIASREGLVALKLYGADSPRRKRNDLADVARIMTPTLSLNGWPMKQTHLDTLEEIRSEISEEN